MNTNLKLITLSIKVGGTSMIIFSIMNTDLGECRVTRVATSLSLSFLTDP